MNSQTDVPFVGRDSELDALRACLADARRGRGHILLVGGEPGIGPDPLRGAAGP